MRREWCDARAGALCRRPRRPALSRLYDFLRSGKLQVRVLPDAHFGLIHGKAGVITLADGRQTAFLGSVNESLTAWRLNYELLWEDDSTRTPCAWVQEEFDALWHSPFAVNLAEAVVQDIGRLAARVGHPGPGGLARAARTRRPRSSRPRSTARRSGSGSTRSTSSSSPSTPTWGAGQGARFVLADQVGLGKTIQLAMAAQLMALAGDRPVLILAPKPLIWQWQGELRTLLDMPSAVWDGRDWVDENAIEHPSAGPESIRKCPRRVGIVSTGLIVAGSEARDLLVHGRYECVILDEAHRARRRNLDGRQGVRPRRPEQPAALPVGHLPAHQEPAPGHRDPGPDPPHRGLGPAGRPGQGLRCGPGGYRQPLAQAPARPWGCCWGTASRQPTSSGQWAWMRNPLPPASEGPRLQRPAPGPAPDRRRTGGARGRALTTCARRTRPASGGCSRASWSRPTRSSGISSCAPASTWRPPSIPETGEPFLKPVQVRLHGERDEDAIPLPPFLEDAYHLAEEFCRLLGAAGQVRLLPDPAAAPRRQHHGGGPPDGGEAARRVDDPG